MPVWWCELQDIKHAIPNGFMSGLAPSSDPEALEACVKTNDA